MTPEQEFAVTLIFAFVVFAGVVLFASSEDDLE